jgi:hypothetical protein
VPDFVDDTSSELERKSKALSVMALVETVSYLVLFYFWIVVPNDVVRKVVGFFHGLVWLAFVSMVVLIRGDIGWTWAYTVAASSASVYDAPCSRYRSTFASRSASSNHASVL